MSKNYKAIYESTNDSSALEQTFYARRETVRGQIVGPTDTDFFYHVEGGGLNHTQETQFSPHKSGRHNTDFFVEKKVTEWTLPLMFNIDTSLVTFNANMIDQAVRLFFESLLGRERVEANGLYYDAVTAPNVTFSLFENGDKWSHQARGAFVNNATMNFPGDGQANFELAGRAADRIRVGIGLSTSDNNAGVVVTLDTAAEAKRFPVGALVMIIKDDGETRSADTPNGSYRTVTARNLATGEITLSGAALADADGSVDDVYLVYAEPEAPEGIANIQTGLVGSMNIDGLGAFDCFRSATVTIDNQHEIVDYCYGKDGLSNPFYVPGGRVAVEAEFEMNLNDQLIAFLDDVERFTTQESYIILGDPDGRHFRIDLPKLIFSIPSVSVPESGSIPVSFTGRAMQTGLNAGDSITCSYKGQ